MINIGPIFFVFIFVALAKVSKRIKAFNKSNNQMWIVKRSYAYQT